MKIEGRHIIITGGLIGLGRSTVARLYREKAIIAIFDIQKENFKAMQSEFPELSFYHCDVTDIDQVQHSVNEFYKQFGSIDILVNNAGILYNEPLLKLSPTGIQKHNIDSWNKTLLTDLTSVFYMTANVAEKMLLKRTKGLIINISSICSAGNAGQSAYSAAKAGVNALTVTWAKELGIFGIRVAAVSPGFMDTESTHSIMTETHVKEVINEIPLRRLGKPEEVAEAIVSIIRNDYYTGSVLELSGGLNM